MIKTFASGEMKSLFGSLPETAEVHDPEDGFLGYVIPKGVDAHRVQAIFAEIEAESTYRQAIARIDPDEVRRLKEENVPGFTTEQVLDHLRALGTP